MAKRALDLQKEIAREGAQYLQELDMNLADIEQAILSLTSPAEAADGLLRVARLVHSVKGSAGSYGFDLISTLCHLFEDHVTVLKMDQDHLDAEIDGLLRYLDALRDLSAAYAFNDHATIDKIKQRYGIQQHGGSTPIISVAAHGATSEPTAGQATNAPTPRPGTTRVLVIEKMGSLLKLINRSLKAYDPGRLNIAIAHNGYEGLGRLLQQRFDCVVMSNISDLLTGVELINILNSSQNPNRTTPFILLTSDKKLSYAESQRPVHVLVKSLDVIRELETALGSVLKGVPLKEATTKTSLRNILLVDDSPAIQRLVEMVIKKTLNLDLKVAATGAEALNALNESPYDLAMLDFELPDMNGAQLAEKILLQHPKQRFMFLTGAEATIQKKLAELKPVAIMKKPFPPMDLVAKLKAL